MICIYFYRHIKIEYLRLNDIDNDLINMSTHIFTPITDRFGYGKYLDVEIVIDSDTGYINASKLCKQNGRRLAKWFENTTTEELIKEWSSRNRGPNSDPYYEIDRSNLIGLVKTEQDQILGKYFHKHLLVNLAQWISPAFALKVSEIVDDYNDRHNRSLLKEKDDKIDELMKKVDTLTEMTGDMKDMMTDMRMDIRRMRRHLDNAEIDETKREGILVYRLPQDELDTIRIRCGTNQHLSKFTHNAKWYREYNLISNAKRALNYLKDNNYITKQTDTKYYLPDKEQRVKLLALCT